MDEVRSVTSNLFCHEAVNDSNSQLTYCGLGDFNEIFDEYFSKPITVIEGWDNSRELPSEECH